MDEEMLEAHIAFEVAAWTESLTETVEAQAAAVLEWLDGVSLGSVVSDADLDALVDALPVPDLTSSLLAVHAAHLDDETPVGDLIAREDYDRVAEAVASMTDLHEAIVEQVTTSEVYADLISHVLLHGIRNYVIAESPIARVPGASSLMRMGQNAFESAVPRLSKGIEKQLTAFVSANLQDTLRESRAYLTTVVDEQAFAEVAADVWERNADTPLSEIAALMPEEILAELTEAGHGIVAHLVATESFRASMRAALEANASRSVGEILAEAGVGAETVSAWVRPWILRAADDGLLEEVVRQRLTAFYESY